MYLSLGLKFLSSIRIYEHGLQLLSTEDDGEPDTWVHFSLSDSSWGVRDEAANSLAISSTMRDIIGEKLESLMLKYEPIASRNPRFRGSIPIFDALQEFAKKG